MRGDTSACDKLGSQRPWMRFLGAIAPLLALACSWGQMNTAEVGGMVQDATGGALPGVTVVLQQTETGQQFTTTSNNTGEYLFAQLPLGVFSLTAGAANFKQAALARLELHAGDR